MKFFKDFSCQPERSATSLGAIAVGKADIVVVDGNPVEKISDIEKSRRFLRMALALAG